MKSIIYANRVFQLATKNTSYLFRISENGHLEHLHYGKKVSIEDANSFALKMDQPYGESVLYEKGNPSYCLDTLPMEYGTSGRGDFREPAIIVRDSRETYVLDFIFQSYEIYSGNVKIGNLPSSYGADETLKIILFDAVTKAKLEMYYAVYYKTDVITRRCVFINEGHETLEIQKIMSFSLDLIEKDMELMTFNGSWINEFNKTIKKIEYGTYVNQSLNGISSAKSNPGYILKKSNTNEESGRCWGFNLVYSGAHYTSVSRNDKDIIRVMSGVNPERFNWRVGKGDYFNTPEVVMTYSDHGMNEMSHHFHDFINEHIVSGIYKKKERPILINSWEAFMFDFKRSNLVTLASQAKYLGIELFVLDDGWFKGRNSDTAGLGDYEVNTRKLPGGIKSLSGTIHSMGMRFGLWVEPEAVNPDSDLYKLHPDWAIENNHETLYERNELLLDLTNPDVRDYIVENVTKLIEENDIDYIKWDMNRQLTGISGDYNYKYIQGLYEVLERIFTGKKVLLETCASGGNRFDLGMLCFSPQIWASDNTDGIERIRIQKNLSYLYPLSTIGAHVSASVSSQALRKVPLQTRFHVACFGCLGYELDLSMLSYIEKKEVEKQIYYYKQHRPLFQYGRFNRIDDDEDKECFEVVYKDAIVGKFRKAMHCAPSFDTLRALDLTPSKKYMITSRPFSVNIEQFGQLLNYLLPVKVNGEGLIVKEVSRFKGLDVKTEKYYATKEALDEGIIISNLYNGTGYNSNVRVPLDFGSEIYYVKELGNEEQK